MASRLLFSLTLLLATADAALISASRTPLRPQLRCRRGTADAVALIGGIDPVEAMQHAHTAAAAAPMVATQLLADDAVLDGLTDEARRAATGELGWWGTYIKFVEDGILGLRSEYAKRDLPYPYGLAIFTFVLGVKLITLPLNWNQLSSAAGMKSIKPVQDRVQLWYGDNDQIKNAAVGNLYENLDVNPLAGCLPALAQIPVFLGVYYSVTSIAKAAIIQVALCPAPPPPPPPLSLLHLLCLHLLLHLLRLHLLGPSPHPPSLPSPPLRCRRASSGYPTSRAPSPTVATASRG